MRKDCFSFYFSGVAVVVVVDGVAVVFISNPSMRVRTNSVFVNPAAHILFFYFLISGSNFFFDSRCEICA